MKSPSFLSAVLLAFSASACAGTPAPAAPAGSAHAHEQAAPAAQGEAHPHDAAPAAPAVAAEPKDPFANATCPIMSKPASKKLHVDTVHGRIYICCKDCIEDIADDVQGAYETAYPHVQAHANTVCPVTGKTLGGKAVDVSIQGHAFRVFDDGAAKAAAGDPVKVLTQLLADEKEAK